MARQKAQAKPPRPKQSTISAGVRKKASDAVAHAASGEKKAAAVLGVSEDAISERASSRSALSGDSANAMAPRRSTRARRSANTNGDATEALRPPSAVVKTPAVDESPRKTRIKRAPDSDDEPTAMPDAAPRTPKKAKTTKTNNYGLTPGITPFPDWAAPSPETCEEVSRLLGDLHGHVKAPKKIPAPSLHTSGCGEVPSILDALVRTLLSANTTNKNSSGAFRSLVQRFGVVQEGVGKGSVDWNKVRLADVEDVIETIKHGGLARVKGNNIKRILDMVYQQNQERREAYLMERNTGKQADLVGSDDKTADQKDLEVLKAEDEVLSLDHMHGMPPDQAMMELTKFPGIGVKTSSCVILFCMQQPSFAVDTHVWRLCKWLGWVPPAASRDQTFSHCEVRVPDHLKYPLHKLLISHGKSCQRCRAITTQGSEGWAEAECPIEHLVSRTGKRGKK